MHRSHDIILNLNYDFYLINRYELIDRAVQGILDCSQKMYTSRRNLVDEKSLLMRVLNAIGYADCLTISPTEKTFLSTIKGGKIFLKHIKVRRRTTTVCRHTRPSTDSTVEKHSREISKSYYLDISGMLKEVSEDYLYQVLKDQIAKYVTPNKG